MPVDIVIPVFNAPDHLKRCMSTLVPTKPKGAKVVVVDDSSTNQETHEYLNFLDQTAIARVVRSEQRRGFAAICNWGVRTATDAEMICLLNQDCACTGGWLGFMVETMQMDPRIGIVGAKLIFPTEKGGDLGGKIQHIGVARDANGAPYHPYRGEPADCIQGQIRREVNAVTGACMLIRRELWTQLRGFDETFHGGQFEDIDFCWKARKREWRIIVDPRAVLYHWEHGSGEEHVKRTHDANRALLLKRWVKQESDAKLFTGLSEV